MTVTARFGVVQAAQVAQYQNKVEDISTGVFLVGRAVEGSGTSEAVWQIKKVVEVVDGMIFYFANGSDNYNKVWDDRSSYTYN